MAVEQPQLLELLKQLVEQQKQLLERQQSQQQEDPGEDGLVAELSMAHAASEKYEQAEEARLQGDQDAAEALGTVGDGLAAQADVARREQQASGSIEAAKLKAEADRAQGKVREAQDNARVRAVNRRTRAKEAKGRGDLLEAMRLDAEAERIGAAASPATDLALAGLVTLTGFTIGPMGTGRCRLYLKPEMNEFVEFADRDVMGKKDIDAAQFPPIGGVIMWLRRGAQVTYTRVTSQQVQADLLSGAIAQAYQTAPSLPPFPGAPGRPGNGAVSVNGNGGGGGDVVYFYSGPDNNTQTSGCL